MFSWFQKGKYRDEAERLLQLSSILSIGSTTSVLNKFPAVEAIFRSPGFSVKGHWDFFLTCAGIGTGLYLFGEQRPSDVRPFATVLLKHLAKWDQQAVPAIEDFQKFVIRNMSAGFDFPTSVGCWVVWNIKGATPSQEELSAAPVIGGLVVSGLRDWHKS